MAGPKTLAKGGRKIAEQDSSESRHAVAARSLTWHRRRRLERRRHRSVANQLAWMRDLGKPGSFGRPRRGRIWLRERTA